MAKPAFKETYGSKSEAQLAARRLERKGYAVTVRCQMSGKGHGKDDWIVEAN